MLKTNVPNNYNVYSNKILKQLSNVPNLYLKKSKSPEKCHLLLSYALSALHADSLSFSSCQRVEEHGSPQLIFL